MTGEEALKLRPGDKVECWYTDTAVKCYVVEVVSAEKVVVRRIRDRWPFNEQGRLYPAMPKHPKLIRRDRAYDPAVANIYADWLEEAGEVKAAALLRAEFPINA